VALFNQTDSSGSDVSPAVGAAVDAAGPEDRLCTACGAANKAWRRTCHQCDAALDSADDARIHQRLFEEVALEAMLNAESERNDAAPPAKPQAFSAFIALGKKARWEAAARDLAAMRDRARSRLTPKKPAVDPPAPPEPAPSAETAPPRAGARPVARAAAATTAAKPAPALAERTKPPPAPQARAPQAAPAPVQPLPLTLPPDANVVIGEKRRAASRRRALALTALIGLTIGILAVSSVPFHLGGASDDAGRRSLGSAVPTAVPFSTAPSLAPAKVVKVRNSAATASKGGVGMSHRAVRYASHGARDGGSHHSATHSGRSHSRPTHHSAMRSRPPAEPDRYRPTRRTSIAIPYDDFGLF
jgi:hypothetical protein